ncbi:MAG: DNA phosphorothioation system sulfurtransferase DndC [Phycisphaerae bacterium]|nr:DNA phosphorothioation system sulfurtransferase DndC [Phycisphaerae bacterium]
MRPNHPALTRESLDACLELIRQQYLSDGQPWVIGYSGGKDSTCVLQLAWCALAELPSPKLTKPVYVITSDTFVESPAVERHLAASLDLINAGSRKAGLPIVAHVVGPTVDDSFWVNLIGRGYPAPYSSFRWCTDRMKIAPATAFIRSKVAEHGEVTILLGARKAESATRAQVMKHRKTRGSQSRVFKHSSLPNAWVFTPIEEWSTQDVWTYLTSTPCPWGGNNSDLVTMYRNAQAGECPLVIDKSTPACGGGRFGCWVCTVVDRDRTMEAMIDNGETWLQPMLDFRNWLAATGDENTDKSAIRDFRRRTGKIQFFIDADRKRQLIHGPFKLAFRGQILKRLLDAQVKMRRMGADPTPKLIRDEELHRIRQIWLHEEGDWGDSLPVIYEQTMGERLEWLNDDWSGMGGAEKKVLEEISREYGVPDGLLVELMDKEREFHGMSRRAGVCAELRRILKKDWRSLEEAWAGQEVASKDAQVVAEEPSAH